MSYERFSSPDQLNYDACLNLVTALLHNTYNDYLHSYAFVVKNEKKYDKLKVEEQKYDEWSFKQSRYNYLLTRKFLNEKEQAEVDEFPTLLKPKKPSKNAVEFITAYRDNYSTVKSCENFWLSKRFNILTPEKGYKGQEIIDKARKEALRNGHRN